MQFKRRATLPPLAVGGGIALAFIIPNHQPPLQNFFHEYTAGLAFLPFVFLSLLNGLRFPLLAKLMVLLMLAAWAQYFLGMIDFFGDAWIVSLYLVGGAYIISAAHSTKFLLPEENELATRSLWVGIILASLASVGISLHQWLGLGRMAVFLLEISPGGRPYGNLGQPNHLATLLLLATVGIWTLWEERWLRSSAAFVGAIVLSVGLALTSSRTPLVALTWLLPLMGYLSYRKVIRIPIKMLLVWVAFFLVFTLSLDWVRELLYLSRGSDLSALQRVSTRDLRLEIWSDALIAIARSPWLGYGWLQTPVAQTAVADGTQMLGQWLTSSHNIILDLVLWLGVPLALAVFVLVVVEFTALLKRGVAAKDWAYLFGIAMVINHAMFEYAELYAYFFFPICWWCGLLVRHPVRLSNYFRVINNGWRAAGLWILFLLTIALAMIIGGEYIGYQSDWEVKRFRNALMDKSIRVPERDPILLDQLDAQLELAAYDPFSIPRDHPPKMALEAARRYPYPSNLLKLAIIQAIDGKKLEAIETMDKLCLLYRKVACESARATWVEAGQSLIPELAWVTLKPVP